MTEPKRERPVLAEQRTALAWSRSSLAIVAIAILLARAGVVGGEPELGFGGAAVLVALAAFVWRAGELELARRLAADVGGRHVRRDRLLLLPAAAVVSAVVALVVTVTT